MSNGTITNFDGDYTLEVSSADGTLSFSFIGFQGLDEVIGGRSEVNVTLTEEVTGLDEVVVTALGIKREKKTLTYSSQEVSGEEMMKSKDVNFMSSLSGKTAGYYKLKRVLQELEVLPEQYYVVINLLVV